MTLWVFDTDHLSLQQRGNALLASRISQVSLGSLATTIVSVEEQLYGRLNQIRRTQNMEAMAVAYESLQKTIVGSGKKSAIEQWTDSFVLIFIFNIYI